jgi:hypothetical protein
MGLRRRNSWPLAGGLVVGALVAFVAAAALSFVGAGSASWFEENGVPVPGMVRELRTRGRSGYEAYSYSYDHGGRLFEGMASRSGRAVAPGDVVEVLVDPADPARSRVRGESGSTGWARAFMVFAFAVGTALAVEGARTGWRAWRRGSHAAEAS